MLTHLSRISSTFMSKRIGITRAPAAYTTTTCTTCDTLSVLSSLQTAGHEVHGLLRSPLLTCQVAYYLLCMAASPHATAA